MTVRIVCIANTHGFHDRLELPDGDVLIHAGDFSSGRGEDGVRPFARWLAGLPHPHKIIVAGDHDFLFESSPAVARALLPDGVTYLQDSGCEIRGIRFWGAPWVPWFWSFAFNLQPGEALRKKWGLIPSGTEVLITHGPPRGTGDVTDTGAHAGCEDLARAVARVRPYLHVFGRIHQGSGLYGSSVNAAVCNAAYEVVHPPVVVELDGTGLRSVTRA